MSQQTADQKIPTETPRSDTGNWAKPTRTLTSTTAPSGAMNLNVTGRRLAGAGTGFGRLWQKSFSVRLEGATVAPHEVIRIWKENFGDFWPKGQRMFLPTTGIAPGEVGLINAKPMPGAPSMATGVLVIYADDDSFSFMTPEGHPFAGPLTFSAVDEGGVTVVKVDELTRASDPFWELAMMMPIGQRMQNDIWRGTLRNIAKHFGVDAQVEERIVCVDRRRQWSQAKNIWQNAGIRSTFYLLGAPVRKLRPRR
jgi:hypothetical protein